MKRKASRPVAGFLLLFLGFLCGCEKDRSNLSDAQLGLTAQQATGRRIYNIYCVSCHPAYSTSGNKGPGLKGLYKKPYLPSGLTATDEHVEQAIVRGRNMMPGYSQITGNDLSDLVDYLHTL